MIGGSLAIVGENLAETVNVVPGERVLDVACGSGTATIPAARRLAEAVGVDFVPALLERGRERAAAERLEIEFIEGDAEQLPFEDESFDLVLSEFGAMFAPDHQRTADELLRVCRPGGRIGMANWTPTGLTGQTFMTVASRMPPPPGVMPPPLWGTEDHLRTLFGDRVSELDAETRQFRFRHFSPESWFDFFRRYFGPIKAAMDNLPPEEGEALKADLIELMRSNNVAGDRAMMVDSDYLEVVAVKAG
ncbi:MAG: class I SAM-dependent methyltransferase [Solirubrobacterales bacterium]|nr:class I SAM-dependent methyltransferase [Solirubrobacterales bacterium]